MRRELTAPAQGDPRGESWPHKALAVAVVGVALAVAQRWTTVGGAHPVDLRVYLAGGDAVLHGRDLYALTVSNGDGGWLRFTYPPFAALLFAPLTLAGPLAPAVFAALSLSSYAVVAGLCARVLGTPWPSALLLGLLGLALEPVQRTLLFGQVNLILLGLVLVDTLAVRGRWRGVLVGVAAGIKLTPLVVVVWFLVKRQYRAAATSLLATAVTAAVGWLVLPEDSQRFWFSAVRATGRFGPEARLWGNQSIGAVLDRATQLHGLSGGSVRVLGVVLCVATSALAVGAAIRLVGAGRDLAALCAVALGGLVAAPVAWTHHYVWVVPVLFVLAHQRSWLLVGATSVVFFLPPMWALTGRGDLQLGYTLVEVVLSAAWVLWAVVLLAWWALRPRVSAATSRVPPEGANPEVRPFAGSGV